MNLIRRLRHTYQCSELATKIRYFYFALIIPLVILVLFCLFNMWKSNLKYEEMINSAAKAGEFSLDFKKDFDYETYLVLVENKTMEESRLSELLGDAGRVVEELQKTTTSEENTTRLISARKYLENLKVYTDRIAENRTLGNNYERNLEIWENDVQIVTDLLRETMIQYIYFEIQDIQTVREEFLESYKAVIRYSVLGFLAVFVIVIFLSYFIPLSITKPIRELVDITNRIAEGDLSIYAQVEGGREVTVLSDSMNLMIQRINELIEQVKREQNDLRKAEFRILQAQINPHFLYNTLDTIVWLAEAGDQKKVVQMVGSLSDFFRTSLNQGKDIVSLKEEIQHVRSYLQIQQVRYMDILEYEIGPTEEFDNDQVPKITIQPLIENALYHGIKNKRGGGRITVEACSEDGMLVIKVRDTGIGMQPERLNEVRNGLKNNVQSEKSIYGLYNVNERIKLNFGDQYGITIESTYGEGTVVTVRLPHSK